MASSQPKSWFQLCITKRQLRPGRSVNESKSNTMILHDAQLAASGASWSMQPDNKNNLVRHKLRVRRLLLVITDTSTPFLGLKRSHTAGTRNATYHPHHVFDFFRETFAYHKLTNHAWALHSAHTRFISPVSHFSWNLEKRSSGKIDAFSNATARFG